MANVRCSICSEQEVGVIDIIHVSYGDRYQVCSSNFLKLFLRTNQDYHEFIQFNYIYFKI